MPLLKDLAARLLGISAFAPPPASTSVSLDDPELEARRRALGGHLSPLPLTRVRWYPKDLENAQIQADGGDMSSAAQLYRAMRSDGTISGLLSTRSAGLVRLPKKFSGNSNAIEALQSMNGNRSIFDEMLPPAELRLLKEDGIMLGIGIGEFVPVPGREHPILIRLEPEFLKFKWHENRWYYRSIFGEIPITPGDGRWFLHMPGGRMSPWQFGAWIPCGDAWISKKHAKLYRGNFGSKLANPARVITAPLGAEETQTLSFMQKLAAWGINTVFSLPVGWDAKLLESNGRGYQVWKEDEISANVDIKMALAGQIVTSEGGTGFINGDLFQNIRSDLIQTDGDSLAYDLNTQGLPLFVALTEGEEALEESVSVEYTTTPPQDLQREATMMTTVSGSIKAMADALRPYGLEVDMQLLASRFNLPVKAAETSADPSPAIAVIKEAIDLAKQGGIKPTTGSLEALLSSLGIQAERIPEANTSVRLELAPTDIAKVVRVDEARTSQGLPPIGDERGKLTIQELEFVNKPAEPGAELAQPPAPDKTSEADDETSV